MADRPTQRSHWFQRVPHPYSPAGRAFDWSAVGLPHPDSPAGRNFDWSALGLPHPDSPAGGLSVWEPEVFNSDPEEYDEIKRIFEKVDQVAEKQSDALQEALPTDTLRTIYSRQTGAVRRAYRFNK